MSNWIESLVAGIVLGIILGIFLPVGFAVLCFPVYVIFFGLSLQPFLDFMMEDGTWRFVLTFCYFLFLYGFFFGVLAVAGGENQ
ncbi:hypothetical protein C437_04740 [Haloarcula vallismortis ATCC 29715]|uniref:DUF456 domain-containing protein n=1 Tax=Haloarcula vallismortis ATCC 29715 TaxID=662477 RepID=M0JQK5_HALVA|nr:hypothetical protein [Haloarcula vallismortis]EMA09935.1 hypothetical protein C437_04740 [Haloarcula vallismortis ATCC 29715]